MIKKKIKRAFRLLLLIAIGILTCGLMLSVKGTESDCNYIFKKEFSVQEKDFSVAIYSFDSGETNSYGVTVSGSENLNGRVRFIPSFPILSGEATVVEFNFVKALVLFLLLFLFVSSFFKKKRKIYEDDEEEEEEPIEEEEEESVSEEEEGCPNCKERVFEGNEYCENCGINIESFKRKQKKKK